jgi:hypothetical protein
MTTQSSSATAPVFAIGETVIRQIDGLFSLNDLHKASGGELKNRPVEFMRLEQTQKLIAEIEKGEHDISKVGIPTFKTLRGFQGGTYACRELVIAYAAWISAVYLKVLRVFLEVVAPQSSDRRHDQAPDVAPSPGKAGQQWILSFGRDGQLSLMGA